MKKSKFSELNLSEEIQKAIAEMGFEEASPIQSEAIPIILKGKDIIGHAQTGTGKTAAFAIPTIELLEADQKELQALILCPTRELVIQVSEQFRKLMKYKGNFEVVPIYGGQEIDRQLRALRKNPQIVIATPGRMMDHMRRGSIRLDDIKIAVLDEADEMLDMGFREDMEVILKDTPSDRQTIMFSATMTDDILNMMKRFQKHPQIIDVTHQKLSAPKIEQIYFEIQENAKGEALARLIEHRNIKLALVFCNTKAQVDTLVELLKSRGYFAEGLHGDLNQKQRDKVMNGFRNGSVEILVATDVAGRGIDVNNVEAVFNYDLPRDGEDYVHRIGRTGRAGKKGIAFSFIVGKQIYNLKKIERINGIKIEPGKIPTLDDLEETKISSYTSKVRGIVDAGHLGKYVNQVERLMGEDYTALDIAAALFKLTIHKESVSFDESVKFESDFKYEDRKPSRKSGGFKNGNFSGKSKGHRGGGNSRSSGPKFDKKTAGHDKKSSGGFSQKRKKK
ncbi:DEAD/DEAH box helicase [Leptospira ellisii]|uniref:DEAD-box ATP-dependent RNA helicase RhpA n=1 Tax=Leptospira ellisii TaxID=2023197 RepID=A0A2N0BNR6_9LEPT|nr:DEAD/DEAH box helicase [Leptospira ellisii]MDV6234242.1 DEAD/DEAH box helicase [Leptospira ellisii]PJZ94729.1 RNA helicase [Leptospira ellisii]PKA05588.1 RNA helicase [Leptospira ellisii]